MKFFEFYILSHSISIKHNTGARNQSQRDCTFTFFSVISANNLIQSFMYTTKQIILSIKQYLTTVL